MNESTTLGGAPRSFVSAKHFSKMRGIVQEQWAEVWQLALDRQQQEIRQRQVLIRQALCRNPC
jgi:hypothetical protein